MLRAKALVLCSVWSPGVCQTRGNAESAVVCDLPVSVDWVSKERRSQEKSGLPLTEGPALRRSFGFLCRQSLFEFCGCFTAMVFKEKVTGF